MTDIVERLRAGNHARCAQDRDVACSLCTERMESADEIALLRSIIRDLDIQVMQPRMDGNHQGSVKNQARLLSHDQWGAIARATQ